MSIKFTIIVPVYNTEKYIEEAIRSVLDQTYPGFELILVDDGSKDASGQICDRYAAKDDRISVLHIENQGQLHARVLGISKATGDYCLFLDADDTLRSCALSALSDAIARHPSDTVIFGYERVADGQVLSQSVDTEECFLTDKAQICRKCFFDLSKNGMSRKAVKTTVFKDEDYSDYYHLRLAEDLLQSLQVYRNSHSVLFLDQILYEYRVNPTSMTQKKPRFRVDFTVRQKALEFLQVESGFTKEDFDRYRDFCINLFVGELLDLVSSDHSFAEKKAMCARIRRELYYTGFIAQGIADKRAVGKRAYIYDLFRKSNDTVFLIVMTVALRAYRILQH